MSISLKIKIIYGTVAGFTLLHLGVCIGRWLSLLVFIRKRILYVWLPSKSPVSETTTVPVAFSPSS